LASLLFAFLESQSGSACHPRAAAHDAYTPSAGRVVLPHPLCLSSWPARFSDVDGPLIWIRLAGFLDPAGEFAKILLTDLSRRPTGRQARRFSSSLGRQSSPRASDFSALPRTWLCPLLAPAVLICNLARADGGPLTWARRLLFSSVRRAARGRHRTRQLVNRRVVLVSVRSLVAYSSSHVQTAWGRVAAPFSSTIHTYDGYSLRQFSVRLGAPAGACRNRSRLGSETPRTFSTALLPRFIISSFGGTRPVRAVAFARDRRAVHNRRAFSSSRSRPLSAVRYSFGKLLAAGLFFLVASLSRVVAGVLRPGAQTGLTTHSCPRRLLASSPNYRSPSPCCSGVDSPAGPCAPTVRARSIRSQVRNDAGDPDSDRQNQAVRRGRRRAGFLAVIQPQLRACRQGATR